MKRAPFTAKNEGDFGTTYTTLEGFENDAFWPTAKEVHCKGMFMGHIHTCSLSIVCDGIRMTFGLKTGTYDSHTSEQQGATLMTLKEDGAQVKHVKSKLTYIPVPGRVKT